MDSLKTILSKLQMQMDKTHSLSLLGLRLVLAYAFFMAAQSHWSNMEGTIWFFDSIGIPFAAFNAYLATFTEFIGALLLLVGLFSRYISLPLIITMLVAIISAHWGNGYEAFKNIPEGSFLFRGESPLGEATGVEIFNAGTKIGDVSVYSTGGMEIPLMYIIMLLVLVSQGSGQIALDRFLKK